MNNSNRHEPLIMFDLMNTTDLNFLFKPLKLGKYKRVTFSNNVTVKEIISRNEITEQNLKDHIWWSTNDYIRFQNESYEDILKIMISHPGIDYNLARKMYYNNYDEIENINE